MIKRFSQFLADVQHSQIFKVIPELTQYDLIRLAMLNTFDLYAEILDEQGEEIADLRQQIKELQNEIARKH